MSNAFSVKISSTHTVHDLKKLISAEKTPELDDIVADKLPLWTVSVPVVAAAKNDAVTLDSLDPKEELVPTDELIDVF